MNRLQERYTNEITKNLKLLGITLSFVSLSLSIVQLMISETLKKLSRGR